MRFRSPDSPRSVQSQESINSRNGLHDNSDHPSGFLTQAPLSSNDTQQHFESALPPSTTINSCEALQDLFRRPQNKETRVQDTQSENELSVGTQAACASVALPVSVLSVPPDRSRPDEQEAAQDDYNRNSEERGVDVDVGMNVDENEGGEEEDIHGSDEDDEDELPQEEITAHDIQSSIEHKRQIQSTSNAGSEPHETLPAMPAAMLGIMRAFRRESLNGRYIPRKLQLIPKAQAELLGKAESWQPPLVGNPHRPGTVPQDLLNALIERADRDAISKVAGTAGTAIQNEQVRGKGRVETQQAPEMSIEDEISSSPSPSSGSDMSEEDWSRSPTPPPKRLQLELPPDSPDEENESDDNADQVFTESLTSERIVPSSLDKQTSTNETLTQSRSESQKATRFFETSQESIVNQGERTSQLMIPDVTSKRSTPLNPSTQPPKHTNNNQSARKSVKVHRTPYVSHQADSSPSHLRSSGSTTYLVPATYDEMSQRNISAGRKERASNIKPSSYNEVMEFEANSSEDGRPMFNGVTVPVVGTKSTPREEISGRAISDKRASQPPAMIPSQNRKRRIDAQVDEFRETRKRNRVATQLDGEDKEGETAYTPVDDSRRRDRRQFYQNLQQKPQLTDHTEARATQISTGMRSVGSADPDMRSSSKGFSIAKVNDDATTSDTGLSTHAATSTMSRPVPLKKTSDSLPTKSAAPFGLFVEFKKVYPDYKGQQHHFVATCQLLKSLRDKAKATHPSLWDDFVFRHYHDYRDHLDLVRETCGNAMPYEVYYETCVEQPTHYKRIIRPAHLDLPFPVVNFVAPQANAVEEYAAVPSPNTQNKTGSVEQVPSEREEDDATYEPPIDNPVRSQESAQSVHLWLERAAGAQSPELGTPKIGVGHDKDTPQLNVKNVETTSLTHARIVVVPRPILQEPNRTSKSTPRSSEKVEKRNPESAMQTPRNTTSIRKSTSFPSTQKKPTINPSSAKSSTRILTPSHAETKIKEQHSLSSSEQRPNPSTSQPHPSAKPISEARESTAAKPHHPPPPQPQAQPPTLSQSSQQIDTIFTRFMRDYNNLACEKGVLVDDPNIQYADFSWITTDHPRRR